MDDPMLRQDWSSLRSEFNHGWLKNQLIAEIRRMLMVVDGRIESPSALGDLRARLEQWEDQREIALRVLNVIDDALQSDLESGDYSSTDLETALRFADAVERRRWIVQNQPHERLSEARKAMMNLDAIVEQTRATLIGDSTVVPGKREIEGLLAAAQRLGDAFSVLTICSSLASLYPAIAA